MHITILKRTQHKHNVNNVGVWDSQNAASDNVRHETAQFIALDTYSVVRTNYTV